MSAEDNEKLSLVSVCPENRIYDLQNMDPECRHAQSSSFCYITQWFVSVNEILPPAILVNCWWFNAVVFRSVEDRSSPEFIKLFFFFVEDPLK